jgi:hypothetical protein
MIAEGVGPGPLVCRAAAGPRPAFRAPCAASLARAPDTELVVSIRGSAATRRVARAMKCTVSLVETDEALAALRPRMVVVDDPSARAAAAWVARARRLDVPVVTIHDLGIGSDVAAPSR